MTMSKAGESHRAQLTSALLWLWVQLRMDLLIPQHLGDYVLLCLDVVER